MAESPLEDLRELARSFGVQVEYVDTSGSTRPAEPDSLMAVLRALGVEISNVDQAHQALRSRRLATWRRRVEPVGVVWQGQPPVVSIRLQAEKASATLDCRLVLPSGEEHRWTTQADDLPLVETSEVEGERFIVRELPLNADLTWGYHRLSIEFDDGEAAESLVIVAPIKAYLPDLVEGKRPWGVFCPLHALHDRSSWGAGDHSNLEALMDWTSSLGGGLVATLPMLATSFDGPNPMISPYSPTSRLFWNEFYLDLTRIPELAGCEKARTLLESSSTQAEVEALRSEGLVAYGRQMALKRQILQHLADDFFDQEGDRTPPFLRFLASQPDVESYAFFQAAGERHGRDWRRWPSTLERPDRDQQIDARTKNYHLYVQWQADQQLEALAEKARSNNLSWYLDFPVGVDLNSFDVWREREVFATGASVGCPPDSVFTKGQNWGFPPLHPDRQREQGYRYLIASFQNHFRYANALRIDHVMGLHRLFWIPDGAEAKLGAFVSTPAEEIYAILSVESHRSRAWIVGEDLGTVPPEVASALKRHDVRGMFVVQYELRPDPDQPIREVPEATVASINTHDMSPFAAFWNGSDLDDRQELGLLDDSGLELERRSRDDQRQALTAFLRTRGVLDHAAPQTGDILQALWNWLAASPASVLLLNVEDFWLETEPQNTPNTLDERPNWRRKLRQSFQQFATDPELLAKLKRVDDLRSRPPVEMA